jgi:hypothetical protein
LVQEFQFDERKGKRRKGKRIENPRCLFVLHTSRGIDAIGEGLSVLVTEKGTSADTGLDGLSLRFVSHIVPK